LLARRTLAHFEASHRRYGWPRSQIRLANRERATVYPNLGEGRPVTNFVVVTKRTLVSVSASRGLADAKLQSLAREQRPL
jgi:hypothetical protein